MATGNRAHVLVRNLRVAPLVAVLCGSVTLLAAPALARAETHVVAPGETLSDIADRYGVTVGDLAAQNGIDDPDRIQAGQVIRVGRAAAQAAPAATQKHVVSDGENLSDIAARFSTSVAAIVELNQIDEPDAIYPGQVLLLPPPSAVPHISRTEARAILRAAEQEFGIPRGLLLALAWQESGWQQGITSDAGAIGITQLLPETADWAIEQFIPDAHNWRGSATDNARMGAAVLAYYLHRSGGDQRLALAAYYQGWRSVFEHGLYDETVTYVDNVLALRTGFE